MLLDCGQEYGCGNRSAWPEERGNHHGLIVETISGEFQRAARRSEPGCVFRPQAIAVIDPAWRHIGEHQIEVHPIKQVTIHGQINPRHDSQLTYKDAVGQIGHPLEDLAFDRFGKAGRRQSIDHQIDLSDLMLGEQDRNVTGIPHNDFSARDHPPGIGSKIRVPLDRDEPAVRMHALRCMGRDGPQPRAQFDDSLGLMGPDATAGRNGQFATRWREGGNSATLLEEFFEVQR